MIFQPPSWQTSADEEVRIERERVGAHKRAAESRARLKGPDDETPTAETNGRSGSWLGGGGGWADAWLGGGGGGWAGGSPSAALSTALRWHRDRRRPPPPASPPRAAAAPCRSRRRACPPLWTLQGGTSPTPAIGTVRPAQPPAKRASRRAVLHSNGVEHWHLPERLRMCFATSMKLMKVEEREDEVRWHLQLLFAQHLPVLGSVKKVRQPSCSEPLFRQKCRTGHTEEDVRVLVILV